MPKSSTKKLKTIRNVLASITASGAGKPLQKLLILSLFSMPIILVGCSAKGFNDDASGEKKYEAPISKVSDYSRVRCDGNIWKNQDDETNANSLYWLRLIDCARDLAPSQARVQAYEYEITKWDGVFKRAILLSRIENFSSERRNALERLKAFRSVYPISVSPLIQLWSDEQILQQSLSDERVRSQRIKESSETQVEAIQAQLLETKHQLNETTRKLENLTDIERQLSSRKMPQNEAGNEPVGGNVKSGVVAPIITPSVPADKPESVEKPAVADKPTATKAQPETDKLKADTPLNTTKKPADESHSEKSVSPAVTEKPAANSVENQQHSVAPDENNQKSKPAQSSGSSAPTQLDTPAPQK